MLSRALILAAVMLLIGGFEADPAQAQATNLEAGKSPSQIFAGTCSACHKSPRGLLKTVAPGSLPGFLRQHYTTSSEMAAPLSAYLISNGATDTHAGGQTKQGKDADAKPSAEQVDRFGRRLRPEGTARPEPQQAARPDADGIASQGEPGARGRHGKRLARPGEAPDAAKPLVEGERGPDGHKLKMGKRGKPGSEEPPKTDAAKDAAKSEPSTAEPAKDDKSKSEPNSDTAKDTAKDEGSKPEGAKPTEAKSEPAKSEPAKPETAKTETAKTETAKPDAPKPDTARIDAPKAAGGSESPALRADPVPAVTPALKSAEGETRPAPTATPAAPAASGAASTATTEPAAPPPAVTASAPPPVAPAGPPAPPISQ